MPLDAPLADDGSGVRVGRALILGPPGSGKTELAIVLCKDWVPEEVRRDRLIVVGPIEKLATRVGVPNHPVDWASKQKQDEFFKAVSQREGAAIVAIDEADMYYTATGRSYGSNQLRAYINLERNHGKGWILVARGDSDVAANTRGNVTIVFMFNTSERNLLRHAQEWFIDVPDAVDYITNLAPHEFMVWCPNLNPHWQGTGKVVNGEIFIVPPPTAPSRDTGTDEEATTPDAPASTPVVASSSKIGSAPPSAPSITPSG